MTISSATSRVAYTGNSSTTAFAVPFYFAANADLVVTVQDTNGAVTTKTLGSDYNLTGATLSAGGTCTFVTAPTTAYIIAITRVPPITQLTSYNNNDPFAAKSHELALDKAATIDQYLKSLIDRAILVPSTDTPPYTTLPAAAQRALKNLSFDSNGNPSVTTSVTGTTISSVMIPVATASTLAIARNAFFNSAGTVQMGGGAYTADDTGILVNRTLTPGSGLLNSHGYRDETVATQNVTGSQFSGYASFDSAPQILGSATTHMNHIRAFQARPVYNSTGSVDEFAGLWTQATVSNGAGTIVNAYGVHVVAPIITAGGITTQTAFYSDPLTGAITSYFLYGEGVNGSTANPSVLKGNLYIGGRINQLGAEVGNIQFNGSTQQGWLFADTYASAGSTSAAAFYRNNSNVGSIQTTLTTTAYLTSSDENLKLFIGPYDAGKAVDIIRRDPVRDYNRVEDGSYHVGWGAQTSYNISSDLAAPGIGEIGDADWTPWSIDLGKRVPYLWAALSNALDRIDTLEADKAALNTRLAAIEARLTAAGN